MSRFGIALLLAAQVSLSAQDKAGEAAISNSGGLIVLGCSCIGALPPAAPCRNRIRTRGSALNPSGSIPADIYDQYYKEFNPT